MPKASTYKRLDIVSTRTKVRTYMISYDARDESYDYDAGINRGMKTLRTEYGAVLVRKILRSQCIVRMSGTTTKRLRNYLSQFLGTDFGIIVCVVSLDEKFWSSRGARNKAI